MYLRYVQILSIYMYTYIYIYIYWHKKYEYVVGSQGVYWKTQIISFKSMITCNKIQIHVKNIYQSKICKDTSWWFQPIWKILVKMGIFPK